MNWQISDFIPKKLLKYDPEQTQNQLIIDQNRLNIDLKRKFIQITSELCKFLNLNPSQVFALGGSIAPVTNGTIVNRHLAQNLGEIILELIV